METRTENQTPHVFTHRRVMNNENTSTGKGTTLIELSAGREGRGGGEGTAVGGGEDG